MSSTGPETATWPFPNPLWPDLPWEMEGTVVTAWFHADPSALSQYAHPDFAPIEEGRQARLRFYDIRAASSGRTIPFREAVVAYKTNYQGHQGEISVLMWTDSVRYFAWGREVFGWPLSLSDLDLQGDLWDSNMGGGGHCQVDDLRLSITEITAEVDKGGSPTMWITPHRVTTASRDTPDYRYVYGVRPRTLSQGRRYRAEGSVDVQSILGDVSDVTIEVVRDVKIEVGSDVVALSSTAVPKTA